MKSLPPLLSVSAGPLEASLARLAPKCGPAHPSGRTCAHVVAQRVRSCILPRTLWAEPLRKAPEFTNDVLPVRLVWITNQDALQLVLELSTILQGARLLFRLPRTVGNVRDSAGFTHRPAPYMLMML